MKPWNDSVDDLCVRNENRPACNRWYFSYNETIIGSEARDFTPPPRKPRREAPQPDAANFELRPATGGGDGTREKSKKKEKKDRDTDVEDGTTEDEDREEKK